MDILTADDLFISQLQAMYDAEHRFIAFQHWALTMVGDEGLRTLLGAHRRDTQAQIANLEKVFDLLRVTPIRERAEGPATLIAEAQADLRNVVGSPYVHELLLVGALARIEHFEIGAYQLLVALACDGYSEEIVRRLRSNLDQETSVAESIPPLLSRLVETMPGALRRAA